LVTPLTTAFKEELPKLMASDMPKEIMAAQKSDKAGDKMIHPQIRKAVLDKLKSINPGKISGMTVGQHSWLQKSYPRSQYILLMRRRRAAVLTRKSGRLSFTLKYSLKQRDR
jgi:hypothetical protein